MLVLNISDVSVVKLLLLRYLLKSKTQAFDVKWQVQTTQTIASTTHNSPNALLVLNIPDGNAVS